MPTSAKPNPTHMLAQQLLQCPSVTPDAGKVLDHVSNHLTRHGFTITRLPFGSGKGRVDNLFARYGTGSPHFCFAGHGDVVPPGDLALWQHPPFAGTIDQTHLHGRGAVDMKGAVACFATAATTWLEGNANFNGSISLLLTGDEEGEAINGTTKVVDWLLQKQQMPDVVLVGEPTCPNTLGEMIKHGRRGSLNCTLTIKGTQGHVAYPKDADNPIHRLLPLMEIFHKGVLDKGNADFDPTTIMVTSIDTDNPASNVIPGEVKVRFNIRFGTTQTARGLIKWLGDHFSTTPHADLTCSISAEPFLTPPSAFTKLVNRAIKDITGITPRLSTSGGTSDARFIAPHCPVIEFGLVGKTMHKINESVALADLTQLTRIYARMLDYFFEDTP
ncbi:MAG: succinyl-diaminopimelate desuccinylase [Proteobacteria bacterium]|nr:succinyl-diaminopimelate desuccinylase [Pseudomonadota bacterium]